MLRVINMANLFALFLITIHGSLQGCESSIKKKCCDGEECAEEDLCTSEEDFWNSNSDSNISGDDAGGDAALLGELYSAYDDDPYHCCGKDEGTSCCSGYEQGMCYKYGGFYERCIPEGAQFIAKIPCAFCCPGLKMSGIYRLTQEKFEFYAEGCGPGANPPDLRICIRCGDGICGTAEDMCNCPDDCIVDD